MARFTPTALANIGVDRGCYGISMLEYWLGSPPRSAISATVSPASGRGGPCGYQAGATTAIKLLGKARIPTGMHNKFWQAKLRARGPAGGEAAEASK